MCEVKRFTEDPSASPAWSRHPQKKGGAPLISLLAEIILRGEFLCYFAFALYFMGQQSFSIKSRGINIWGLAGYYIRSLLQLLCHFNTKAAIDCTEANVGNCLSNKTLFTKIHGGPDLARVPWSANSGFPGRSGDTEC